MEVERLDEGTFGTCLDCGEAVPLARLLAVPWASYCATHQEALEARLARRAFGAPHRRFPSPAQDEESG